MLRPGIAFAWILAVPLVSAAEHLVDIGAQYGCIPHAVDRKIVDAASGAAATLAEARAMRTSCLISCHCLL